MSQTLEQRVEMLERKFSELTAQVLGLRRKQQDWRSVCGTLKDDEIAREAEKLGREYRAQQTLETEIARS